MLGVQEEFLILWALGIENISGLALFTVHIERTECCAKRERDFLAREAQIYIPVRELMSYVALGQFTTEPV